MTRVDVVRRTAAVALMCLVGSAVFVRLFGVMPVLTRIWPVIILCCVGYAVGTAGGQRVQRGMGALVALVATVAGTLALGAMTIQNTRWRRRAGQLRTRAWWTASASSWRPLCRRRSTPRPSPPESWSPPTARWWAACWSRRSFRPAAWRPPHLVFLGGLMLSQGSPTSPLPVRRGLHRQCRRSAWR
ncbi:MAG: hypothetical protein V9G10_03160 [Candidatus Nanopelagicales bacterium]